MFLRKLQNSCYVEIQLDPQIYSSTILCISVVGSLRVPLNYVTHIRIISFLTKNGTRSYKIRHQTFSPKKLKLVPLELDTAVNPS